MWLYSEREGINMAPEYQRSGGVWTKQKKQLLIDSIINDYDIPKLYFHKLNSLPTQSYPFEYSVIDGRQRLEAIWDFIEGKFTLADDIDYQKDESINLGGLGYNDLAQSFPRVRIKFDSFVLPIITVETEDVDLIEDMFSRLNEAVPLNAAEKRNAIGGDMVQQIRETSMHDFFANKVSFSNHRAQHKEIAGRFLLLETHLLVDNKVSDTKREFLDRLARDYKEGNLAFVKHVGEVVKLNLSEMSKVFLPSDPILRAQGIMAVYYLLFRGAVETKQLGNLTREKIIGFREMLSSNKLLAEEDFTNSDYELLEFDRLSQQGTNDSSSIRTRYKTLAKHLGVDYTLAD